MSRLTLATFLLASAVAVLALVTWLIVMIGDRDPRWPRRITLTAAGVALAALVLNAFL